ncbi:MAG: hypothetical protein WBQ16_00955 [Nitrososphaeraceae archaeon]
MSSSPYIFGGTKGDVLNILSLVILTLGVSLLIATIVGTFNHEYDYTRRVIGEPVGLSDIKHLRGNIISVQIDKSSYPLWMLSGKWRIDDFSENKTNYGTNLKLSANITMVGTNGTGEHKHRLIDFRFTNITFSNRLAIINGTASLMTSGNEPPGLPALMTNIPITTKIENLRTISINIDKKISNHHFGELPIFGSVLGRSSE